MTSEERRKRLLDGMCELCVEGVPLVTYPPSKVLFHAEDGDAIDVAERCTANHAPGRGG